MTGDTSGRVSRILDMYDDEMMIANGFIEGDGVHFNVICPYHVVIPVLVRMFYERRV